MYILVGRLSNLVSRSMLQTCVFWVPKILLLFLDIYCGRKNKSKQQYLFYIAYRIIYGSFSFLYHEITITRISEKLVMKWVMSLSMEFGCISHHYFICHVEDMAAALSARTTSAPEMSIIRARRVMSSWRDGRLLGAL